ncbi:vegetative cell wall protein gp1-like [Setaria italica]|uniref:vegetative cell wall protein gp1-like n=1 Tax=Setaria italica TaxID=4555 RepID=UPI000350D9E9|nr:vegetative cell wall protein gp1-like [Setaria italica]
MAVAAAAAPLLLPIPTARSLPAALLPTPPPTGRLIPSPDSPAPPIHRLSPSPAYIPPCRRLAACSPYSPRAGGAQPRPLARSRHTFRAHFPRAADPCPLGPVRPAVPPPRGLLARFHRAVGAPPRPLTRSRHGFCAQFARCDPHPAANPPPHRLSCFPRAADPCPLGPVLRPPLTRRLFASPASPAPPIHRLPPSLVYVPPSRRLAACSPDSPAPSAPHLAPSPAPAAPSASNPGRTSASKSWFRDKAARADRALPSSLERNANLALPSLPKRIKGFKVPGRVSLSWVKDRVAGSDVLANSGCRKRNLTSPADNIGKKMRYESPPSSEDSGSDSELEFYAGPAFRLTSLG